MLIARIICLLIIAETRRKLDFLILLLLVRILNEIVRRLIGKKIIRKLRCKIHKDIGWYINLPGGKLRPEIGW